MKQRQRKDSSAIHHKVLGLVVHGIGEQKLGWTLKDVLGGFLPLVRRIDPTAGVDAKPLDEGDPSDVAIRFGGTPQGGASGKIEGYELRFTEVWWARTFEPPSIYEMVFSVLGLATNFARKRGARQGGTLKCLAWLLGFILAHIIRSVILVVFTPVFALLGMAMSVLPAGPRSLVSRWRAGLLSMAAYGQRAIVDLLVIGAAPFVLLFVLMPLRILEFVIPNKLMPEGVGTVHTTLVNILTRHLGDMWLYLYRPWEASRIRARFEQRLCDIAETIERDPDKDKVDAVMVIAHSMGSVVAFEAITGRRMTELINNSFAGPGKPKLYFVTVGSALNLAWDVVPKVERPRFYRPLPSEVEWLNVWSRFDPVALGDLRVPPEAGGPLKYSWRVVNQMDLLSDHVAYWNNAEQVLAPLLNLLTHHGFDARLNLDAVAREKRVQVLTAFKALAWLIAPVAGLAVAFAGGGAWITEQLLAVFGGEGSWWQDYVLSPAGRFAAVAACAGLSALIYSTVVKWVWDFWDRSAKYRPAP
jgi:hypothetical protein